jgi:phage terminase large subunit GpA-like protein
MWSLAGAFSFYEQQTLESHPCPHCGAYTLACSEPANKPVKSQRMRILRRALRAQTPHTSPKLIAG